jgi:hypothetical protein
MVRHIKNGWREITARRGGGLTANAMAADVSS